MKTVLVVGGVGYIDSHMVGLLARHEYQLVVLDYFNIHRLMKIIRKSPLIPSGDQNESQNMQILK